ncbi:hypothetical protein ACP6EV_11680 [Aeromonas hydrophila]|uniref:hypothetical protein n=1 Tax=Aeromonas hydrophila TaxID=644 RepID=UPI003CE6ABDA
MNDSVNSIKEFLASRLNNVLIGSFILSWIVSHSRQILTFIFSTREEKLAIINEYQPTLHYDLIVPIAISLFYIICIPILGEILKRYVTNKIFSLEIETEANRKKIQLMAQSSTSILEAKASNEYGRQYAFNELDEWIKNKNEVAKQLVECEAQIKYLKAEVAQTYQSEQLFKNNCDYYKTVYEQLSRSIDASFKMISNIIDPQQNKFPIEENAEGKYDHHSKEFYTNTALEIVSSLLNMAARANDKPNRIQTPNDTWTPPVNENPIKCIEKFISDANKINDE